MKGPSRPLSGAPQLRQVIWRSTDSVPGSVRTILYWAPQLGQSKGVIGGFVAIAKKGHTPAMPRKKTKSIVAAHWAAEARRIVADQNELIMTLEASGRSALAAERALQTYLSALKHLEDHERRIGEEDKGKKGETKKDRRFRKRIPRSAG